MTTDVPRLRMFAGPNGSGKSTIRSLLRPELLGIYINPDEIQDVLQKTGTLEFREYGVAATSTDEISRFFGTSALLEQAGLKDTLQWLSFLENAVTLYGEEVSAYLASVAADFIRRKLLATKTSFTFETVMSAVDKIQLLQTAKQHGYRTYLYYIATEDPAINISRIRNRVKLGGHDVPEDKIVGRYHRSLSLLMDAIRHTDRAYVFDNSGAKQHWIAEITDGKRLELKTDQVPLWFQQAVLDKATPPG